ERPQGLAGADLVGGHAEAGDGDGAGPGVAATIDDVEDDLALGAARPRPPADLAAEAGVGEGGPAAVVGGPPGHGVGNAAESRVATALHLAAVERDDRVGRAGEAHEGDGVVGAAAVGVDDHRHWTEGGEPVV